jgi:Tfp pilus assembly protein PilW
MNKKRKLKAFTIIELMVSIFITMIVIASFYKLYDTASKAERSSAIRVSVNLLGEQMLDTISDAVRFIGLNSKAGDFSSYNNSSNDVTTIIRTATASTFSFLSPYGGPITKLAEDADGTYPTCTFKIYNSAAFNGSINSFYLHTQDGIYETKRKVADPEHPGDIGYAVTYGDYTAEFSVTDFESAPKVTSGNCKDIFPAGTLISGTDRLFTLQRGSDESLVLYTQDKTVVDDSTATSNNIVQFNPNTTGQTYKMPHFVINYLVETKEGTGFKREWKDNAQNFRKDIIAVRFGFILVSERDRNKVGTYSGDKNKYCIFGDGSANDCYELDNPNYTVNVFRRVIYLSNHRFLKDAKN